jgi:hypothetical protein
MHFRTIAVFTLLLAFGSAMAEDNIPGIQSKQDFMAMKAKVNKEVGDGKQYKEISPEDQKVLMTTLARMDDRWQKADDVAQLNPNDRVAMANDQEVVITITQHAAADSRMVCQRVEPIGSHFPKNVCQTVAQMRREQDKSQDSMRAGNAESH